MTVLGPQWSNDGGNPNKPRLLYWPMAPLRKPLDLELFFEPRDLWLGLFVDSRCGTPGTVWERFRYRHLYVCLVPCCPLHIWWAIK